MLGLQETLPEITAQFAISHFTVNTSWKSLFLISIDQAQDHNNKLLKGDGGSIGFLKKSSMLDGF